MAIYENPGFGVSKPGVSQSHDFIPHPAILAEIITK